MLCLARGMLCDHEVSEGPNAAQRAGVVWAQDPLRSKTQALPIPNPTSTKVKDLRKNFEMGVLPGRVDLYCHGAGDRALNVVIEISDESAPALA